MRHLELGPKEQPLLQRSLGGARAAYASRDAEASAQAHGRSSLTASSVEPHVKGGEYIKSVVFGGLDGILTSFAIVAGAAGAGLQVQGVLAIGVSNVLADALAMGVGEYLSCKSEKEYILEERARESWEFENCPDEERGEMVEIFQGRGMSEEDAREVIMRLSKYPEVFIDLMMTEELGLQVPDPAEKTWLKGLIMFAAFVSFGVLPVLGYVGAAFVVREASHGQERQQTTKMFVAACVVTGVTLTALGAVKAAFTHRRYLRSALETLVLGGACATLSYTVGLALSSLEL